MTKKRPISFVCTCLSIAIISCLLSTISVGAETINRGYGGYGLYGDLNGDGIINETDLDIISKHIAADRVPEIKSQNPNWILKGDKIRLADINKDNVVDPRDRIRISEHIRAVKTGTNPNWRIVTVYLEHGINAGEGRKSIRKPYRGNELYSVLPATLNKSGYKFQGWYTAQSGGTKVTNSSSVGLTSHVLYAHYKKNTVAVSGIKLNKSSASVKAGSKIALTATISPSNATNKNVTWTSSNTKVATVSGGTVKGVSAGTATITAKSNNGKTATCKITVGQFGSQIPITRKITVYKQTDSRWRAYPYGYSSTSNRKNRIHAYLGQDNSKGKGYGGGCGVLSVVNAVYYLKGTFIQPKWLADFSVNTGARYDGGTFGWLAERLCKKKGNAYGIKFVTDVANVKDSKAYLKRGNVAIIHVQGHFMALVNYDSKTDKYLVIDSCPSNRRGTSKGYRWLKASEFTGKMALSWVNEKKGPIHIFSRR